VRLYRELRCPVCGRPEVEETEHGYQCHFCGERWGETSKRFGQHHADL
jgi:ribosomal protein L37AE/L43A